MPQYEVEMRLSKIIRVEVEADSPHDAAVKAGEIHPEYSVEVVGDSYLFGCCEGCRLYLFEDDDYAECQESGVKLCRECNMAERPD